jgi:serine protease Do
MTTSTASLSLSLAAVIAASCCSPAAADTLKERQDKVTAAVGKTRQAVVCIQSRGKLGMGSGSGVIVSADGLVLTAAHVVDAAGGTEGEGGEVDVVLPDGRQVKGKVLGRDRNRDSAMVQIEGGKDLPFAEPAKADSVEKGEWCIAMGHPGGFDIQRGAPVRVGRLWMANDKAFYRSDCTVSGGDSGGPLFDLDGKVIGIHSNISMDVSENRHVPIGVFHDEWDRLKKGDVWGNSKRLLSDPKDLTPKEEMPKLERPKTQRKEPKEPSVPDDKDKPADAPKGGAWLGVQLADADDGVTVGKVADNSPAAKAGLKTGDVITKLGGKGVGSTGDIISKVRESGPGDKLKLTVQRDGKEENIDVTLAAKE